MDKKGVMLDVGMLCEMGVLSLLFDYLDVGMLFVLLHRGQQQPSSLNPIKLHTFKIIQ